MARHEERVEEQLEDIIARAWRTRVKPVIDRDPDELARRLARRRGGMMRRPVRAWCLAVRASDQRINGATTARFEPESAAYPAPPGYANEWYHEHRVTVDAALLRRLVNPFYIPKPGLEWTQVAEELGISTTTLKHMMRRGLFQVHYVQNLGGKWGRPIPMLYTDKPLDPCNGRGREYADILWGTMWRWLGSHVPDGLEQTLERVPHYIPHPEGSAFMGWHWICPSCRKTARMLFYPLPPLNFVQLLEREFHDTDPAHPDAIPKPPEAFACMRCHNVLYCRRLDDAAWNKMISHLTAGLMYGHEVPRPSWFKHERKVAFHPILRRPPSRRRQMIFDDIIAGLSYRQIMRKQGIALSTVSMHAAKLYEQYRVKGPDALRAAVVAETSNSKKQDTDKLQISDFKSQTRVPCSARGSAV